MSPRLFTFGVGGRQGARVHEFPLRDHQRFAQAPISGRFLRGRGRMPPSHPEAAGSGGRGWGPGVTQGRVSAGPPWGRGEGAVGRGAGRGRAWRPARRSRCRRCRALAGPSIRLSSSAPSGRSLRPHGQGPARGQRPGGGGAEFAHRPGKALGWGWVRAAGRGSPEALGPTAKLLRLTQAMGRFPPAELSAATTPPPAKGGPTCSWELGSAFRLLSAALLCPSSVT